MPRRRHPVAKVFTLGSPSGRLTPWRSLRSVTRAMKGVVEVRQGRLRGVHRGDLWSFSGIPYAKAPVGPLRWRPPAEAERWDGIRDASTFGPIAPQSASLAGITSPSDPDNSEPHSEDCLSLNVWTPALPGTSPPARDEGRPVMVFIHGGGFTSGSGSVFLYRGGNLVRNGDGVVVTLNYRLGALGFLGHRRLSDADGHVGNWGLHDQVTALRWVRDNIAVFGGDPRNVTIFGESAGGFSIAALLGAPEAAGLFHRAIIESGGAYATRSRRRNELRRTWPQSLVSPSPIGALSSASRPRSSSPPPRRSAGGDPTRGCSRCRSFRRSTRSSCLGTP